MTRRIPIVCPGHSRPLAEVQYSDITPEGVFLISACHDKMPMLRHGDTGDWIGTFEGHKGAVWSAQLNKQATIAATGSADFSVKLWDAVHGTLLNTFEHGHIVKSIAFTTDGRKLVTAGHEKIVRVYDLHAMLPSSMSPQEGSKPIRQIETAHILRKVVAISESIIVTGEVDGTVSVWDIDSGHKLKTFTIEGANGSGIMDMESSRNHTILTVAAGKKVSFYDITKDFNLIASFAMPISFAEEGGASLHPTEPQFIAGGSDTWVRVFDFHSGEMLECRKGHHGPVRCLRYAPSGASFATGSEDGTIRIWQTEASTASTDDV